MKKRLYLVDVSSMYFRSFYAIRSLSNKSGMPTNALYGFLSMSIKLMKELKPDYLAYCFDTKEKNFRFDLYKDYKANRSEMPEDLIPQVPYVRKITEALGIPCFEKVGFEADDVIGTLTELGKAQGLEVTIVSGDKDFAQLVGPTVTMLDTMKDVRYDEAGVIEKWGVKPNQVQDYLALIGDSSDNVPGVSGIGPKGAQKLLSEYHSLEGVFKNLANIKNEKLRIKLVEGEKDARLSWQLVEIRKDVPLNAGLKDLEMKAIHAQTLRDLLVELDFRTFERKLLGEDPNGGSAAEAQAATRGTSSHQEVSGSESHSASSDQVVLPFEVQGGAASHQDFGIQPELSTVSVPQLVEKINKAQAPFWSLQLPQGLYFGVEKTVYQVEGDTENLAQALSSVNAPWKGFQLKELWKYLNVKSPRAAWDHSLSGYLLQMEVDSFHSIYSVMAQIRPPDIIDPIQYYSMNLQLEQILLKKLEETDGLRVYQDIELPLLPILLAMEQTGIKLDSQTLRAQSQEIEIELKQIEKEVIDEVGETFSLASPKQLGHILFEKLKMPKGRKTKTGYSTDSDVLESLSHEFPICLKILEHRELSKLKSTYLDALPLLVNPNTGRLHTTFNQAVTQTGRLSSTHPNLQNIPIRTERGQKVRQAFIAESGNKLISADYSQIELRLLAHITGDPGLVAAFEQGLDIHSATAAEVFGIDVKSVSSEQRRIAKAVNFGLAYGMGAFGLAENLKIPRGEAQQIIDRYFKKFQRVQTYMTETVEEAKKQGYVKTLFGRRRYLKELTSKNANIRKFGERAAINAPMQGTAADIVKISMINSFKENQSKMLLQVHDELVFETADARVESETERIREAMEGAIKLSVPMKVEIHSGLNWDEAH